MKCWTVLACLGAALLVGCGSDTVVQFGTGGASGTGGAGSSSGQGGSATTGSGGSGGTSGQGGSATTGTGGAGGSSGQGGSATTGTGGTSGAGGGGTGTIACGMAMCDAATQKCCANMQGQNCIDKAMQCQGVSLDCTSAANCASGDVCCMTFNGPNMPPTIACATQCMGTQVCATSAECPMGLTCKPGMFPGGLMTCSP